MGEVCCPPHRCRACRSATIGREGKRAGSVLKRAWVLLKADADGPNWKDPEIAEAFGVSLSSVHRVRQVDETSKKLLAETRQPVPAAPGRPERIDYEYERNGTANLFMVTEPLVGQRYMTVTERRTSANFAKIIRHLVDCTYADAEKIVLAMAERRRPASPASIVKASKAQKGVRSAATTAARRSPVVAAYCRGYDGIVAGGDCHQRLRR
jgi:hypothetical protein